MMKRVLHEVQLAVPIGIITRPNIVQRAVAIGIITRPNIAKRSKSSRTRERSGVV